MRDLSLHILNLAENSIEAGAGLVEVEIVQLTTEDVLQLRVSDDGSGLKMTPETVLDPFFTTKSGKRIGLGLSLLKAAAERSGGSVTLERSPHGGLTVLATMRLSHVDRCPLGDVAATMAAALCAESQFDLRCVLQRDDARRHVQSLAVREALPVAERIPAAVAATMAACVRDAMAEIGLHG